MPTCLFPFLYVLYALCHLPCTCALHAMFVCLSLDLVSRAMCCCSPIVPFIASSCVFGLLVRTQSRPYKLCHCPNTEAHIKGFGSPYFHVYACLLLYFMPMLAFLILGFAMLDAFCGLDLVWLHLTPMRPSLDVTTWDASQRCLLLRAYLSAFCTPCDDILAMLVCAPIGFICIFTCLFTCSCMSLACQCVVHASTQWSYGHLIQTSICLPWTPTFVCLFACLLVFLPCRLSCLSAYLVACHVSYHILCFFRFPTCLPFCLFACFPAMLAMSIMLIYFMPLSYTLCTFSFHCLSVGFFSLPLHVHTWSEDAWS